MNKIWFHGAWVSLALVIATLIGTGTVQVPGDATATPTATPTATATPAPGAANIWVDATGGASPTRCSVACSYSATASYDSLATASAAASPGDVIRMRAATYGPQICTGPTGGVTVIGATGTVVQGPTSGTFSANQGLALSANCDVSGVDVGGGKPFVFIGSNSRWSNGTMLEATINRTCSTSDPEPILVQKFTDPAITNAALGPNITVEAQYGADAAHSGCGGGGTDPYHLEANRIDQKIDGYTIDRVTFARWPGPHPLANSVGYGSGQVFVDGFSGSSPTNITVRNSRFEGPMGGNFHMQVNDPVTCGNYTLAYNTFENAEPLYVGCGATGRNIRYIANLGSRPQNCLSGVTYTRNVWQRPSGSPCGTDTLVTGPSFTLSAAGVDSNLRLQAGSPAINAGETPGMTDYCTHELGSVDRDGDPRPVGIACDAGADER